MRIECHKPPDQIFKFAHVAGPRVPLEPFDRGGLDGFLSKPFAPCHTQEVPDKIANVFLALAQRRQPHRHDVQAVEQILAKQALLNLCFEIAMRRRDDAHVGFNWRTPANSCVFALLQHAQQPRLRLERHVADFVQEQRSAFRLLKSPGGARLRASERAFLVSEEFALYEFARNGRHVDGNERTLPALAKIVQNACD